MTTLAFTFDTLKITKRLTAAGMSQELAETEAEILSETLSNAFSTSELISKADLREFEARIEAKIESANANMIKWLAGLMIAQGAAVAALVKLI